MFKIFICPRCGKRFEGHPALSRKDNKTDICSNCGVAEAMEDWIKYLEKQKKTKRG